MGLPTDIQDLHMPLHGCLNRAWSLFLAYRFIADLDLPERQLLDRAAPGLNWLLLDTLADEVILQVARMMDPARTGGQLNATFRRLGDVVRLHMPASAAAVYEQHLASAQILAKGMRERRNKQLAHLDLAVATGASPAVTSPFSTTDIEECLQQLAACLNSVYSFYVSFEFPYNKPLPPYDQSLRSLIETLRRTV